jgi:hypothetical protein
MWTSRNRIMYFLYGNKGKYATSILELYLVKKKMFSVKNFLMICGIALPLYAREITLGISESCVENLNTINHVLLSIKCYIYMGVDVREKSHTYTEVFNTSNVI